MISCRPSRSIRAMTNGRAQAKRCISDFFFSFYPLRLFDRSLMRAQCCSVRLPEFRFSGLPGMTFPRMSDSLSRAAGTDAHMVRSTRVQLP
jgi:hypothetical protein